MSNIIGTVYKNDSKTEYTTNTYLHFNGVVLLIYHWVVKPLTGIWMNGQYHTLYYLASMT